MHDFKHWLLKSRWNRSRDKSFFFSIVWVIFTEKWNALLKTTAECLWISFHFVKFKLQFYILPFFISILKWHTILTYKLQHTFICQWPLCMNPGVIKHRQNNKKHPPRWGLFSRFLKLSKCNVLCVSHLNAFAHFHWIACNGATNSTKQHCDTLFALSQNPLYWCRSA